MWELFGEAIFYYALFFRDSNQNDDEQDDDDDDEAIESEPVQQIKPLFYEDLSKYYDP